MDSNESKPNDVRMETVVHLVGPDGKILPVLPTENPNPDPDPEAVWRALRKNVPEVTTGRVKILGLARQPGRRSVIAVASNDPRSDPLHAIVGHRGERVKRMMSELGGEAIDVVRWDESTERFLANLLAPLQVTAASFEEPSREAKVRAVGRPESRNPNIELRSKLLMELTGWKLHLEIE
jgi:transcription termination/antitermination protein NusA